MTKAELIEAMKDFPDECHVVINTMNPFRYEIRYEECNNLIRVDKLTTDCALLIVLSGGND